METSNEHARRLPEGQWVTLSLCFAMSPTVSWAYRVAGWMGVPSELAPPLSVKATGPGKPIMPTSARDSKRVDASKLQTPVTTFDSAAPARMKQGAP